LGHFVCLPPSSSPYNNNNKAAYFEGKKGKRKVWEKTEKGRGVMVFSAYFLDVFLPLILLLMTKLIDIAADDKARTTIILELNDDKICILTF